MSAPFADPRELRAALVGPQGGQPFIKKLTGRLFYMHFALQLPHVIVIVVVVVVLIRSVLLIRSTFEAPNQNLPPSSMSSLKRVRNLQIC